MSSYRVPSSNATDSQAEQFRKYLENGGVLQTVQKVLTEMYEKEEKPKNPLKYFKERLGINTIEVLELESLRKEVQELSREVEQLRLEKQQLLHNRDYPHFGKD